MDHDHLDPEMLERLLREDRSEDQNRCLFHQIAVCPECRKAGGYLLDLHLAGLLPVCFGPVDVALARSRAEAPALWESLSCHPLEEQTALVRTTSQFASLGLCELLCRASEAAAADDASLAVGLGELAVLVADGLDDGSPFEERWIYQVRALAWAHLGNARRVRSDFQGADEAFSMSDSWWTAGEEGVGDALGYFPLLLDLKATFRSDQRCFPEALALLERAFQEYGEAGGLAGAVSRRRRC